MTEQTIEIIFDTYTFSIPPNSIFDTFDRINLITNKWP